MPTKSALRWIAPFLAVSLAAVLRELLSRKLGAELPASLTFLPAVMLAAVVAGARAGLIATALSTAVLLLRARPAALSPSEAAALALFVVVGALMSVVAGLYRLARESVAVLERERARARGEEFRAFFHNCAVGTARLDRSGRFTRVNDRLCRITGFPAAELGSLTPDDLVAADPHASGGADLARVLRGELASCDLETRWRRRQGGSTWVHLSAGLIRDSAGRPAGAALVVDDLSSRRSAEEALRCSELELRAVADNIPQLAWMADESGALVWCSTRWYDYTGVSLEQTRGEGWLEIVHPDDAAAVADAFREAVAKSEPFESTLRMRSRDGSYRWFLTQGVPIRESSGRATRWFGTNTDITRQQRREELLRAADRRKDEFLAVLSHELRNPLAPIRNSLYVLQRTAPGSGQASRALSVVERQVGHIARLVDDLLDVARIGRGKLRLEWERLELGELVRRVVEDYRDGLEAGGVALEIETREGRLPVRGDATRLAQVFGNLLHNAGKFTPPGGRIQISLRRADSGAAEIRVSDTGQGIDADALERLFQPFVQHERTVGRSRGGLGLGLALVKGIVELHGGRVWAASDGPGRGSVFTVQLPLDERQLERPRATAGARAPRRVLVIENELDAARSLKEALELSGHVVELALNSAKGIELARQLLPDVVICDIGLPGLDGLAVARALRADPQLRTTRLIALSAYTLEADLERCRAAGFDRHLAKPADPEVVENAVASLLV